MLSDFCVRLACGLAGATALCSPEHVSAGYFRNRVLAVLGLCAVAALAGPAESRVLMWAGTGVAWLGFVQWSLGWTRAGRATLLVLALLGAAALMQSPFGTASAGDPDRQLRSAAALSSAALLGSTLAAMLLGHWYLVTPAMSMDPLFRLIRAIGAALAVRGVIAVVGLAHAFGWAASSASSGPHDVLWWSFVAARFAVGLVAPAVLAWMVWQTARIRSTQSATGILYASVSVTFFGELLALILDQRAGTIL